MDVLRCPQSGERLVPSAGELRSVNGEWIYPLSASGIPLMAEHFCSPEARRQQEHYSKIHETYIETRHHPHTQVYTDYLDRILLHEARHAKLDRVAELCCGQGDAFALFKSRIGYGVGVDVSAPMLEVAQSRHPEPNFRFVQGDVTMCPLQDNSFDTVFMLGGIHHVPPRQQLFDEVFRILKPGGRFIFREPVSDFFLWKWLRAIIYRLSPVLDEATERPLQWEETVPLLQRSGFEVLRWKTCGFIGFCLFMNGDVLKVVQLFRCVPGIETIVRLVAHFDTLMLQLPGMSRMGLQVVGVAEKPIR